MSLASTLLLHGVLVAALAPPVLRYLDRNGLPPAVGIGAWLAAMLGGVVSWTAAVALAGVAALRSGGDLHALFVGCVDLVVSAIDGGHGPAARAAVLVGSAATVLASLTLLVRVVLLLGRARARTRQHRDIAFIVADRQGPSGALVVDVAERAVYSVAGRPPAIVMTSAALDCLDAEQIAAVLAHERAHLAGRHHMVVALSRALAKGLPRVPLFRDGASAVARLVELRADDVAAQDHGRHVLVDALIALNGRPPATTRALAVGGTAVAERVDRLLSVPEAGGRTVAGAAAARMTSYLLGAVLLAGLPATCVLIFG